MPNSNHMKSNNDRGTIGLKIVADSEIARVRNSHAWENNPYDHAFDSPDAYDRWTEAEDGGHAYDKLNDAFHDRLREELRDHFSSKDPAKPSTEQNSLDSAYKKSTHQNWDWFDPHREIRLQITEDAVTRQLLSRLQRMLAGEYSRWCIVLFVGPALDVDCEYEMLVFSDSVFVPSSFAARLHIE